jgi:hypothetical protein
MLIAGAWSKEEEAKLIEIVKNVNTTVGNDPLGHEAPWDIVEERMGGTRSRMQCRKKWLVQARETWTWLGCEAND